MCTDQLIHEEALWVETVAAVVDFGFVLQTKKIMLLIILVPGNIDFIIAIDIVVYAANMLCQIWRTEQIIYNDLEYLMFAVWIIVIFWSVFMCIYKSLDSSYWLTLLNKYWFANKRRIPPLTNAIHVTCAKSGTELIRFNIVNIMGADALALCVARTSAPMILTM